MAIAADQAEMFPHFARNTVVQEIRDSWNQFIRDQDRLGGLVPPSMARLKLGVSKARVHELMEQGKLRYVTHDGHRYISAVDVVERAKEKRDGFATGGRPKKTT